MAINASGFNQSLMKQICKNYLNGKAALLTGALALALTFLSVWAFAGSGVGTSLTVPDPLITKNLYESSASLGENFRFEVEATGTAPLEYQWSYNGSALAGATNSQLTLTNVNFSNEGFYQVNIKNGLSNTNSIAVFLSVVDIPARILVTDNFESLGTDRAKAQVSLISNGQESSVSFSLSYRADRFSSPTLIPSRSDFTVTTDPSRLNEGLVGFTVSAAPGETFPNGDLVLGDLQFTFSGAVNPYQGAVNFTNTPVGLGGIDFLGNSIEALTTVRPQLVNTNTPLILNPQSGLFEQTITLANPSGVLFSNVNALVYWPTNSIPTNTLVTLNNSQGTAQRDFTGDGLLERASYVQSAEVAPGSLKLLTLEYYISDRTTLIQPSFTFEILPRVVLTTHPAAEQVPVLTNRYFNGSFHIEFPTRRDWLYFIEYADTMEAMNAGNVKTVNPTIIGTGYRVQWIDNGPPKTETPAFPGSRFYRVKELR